VTTDVAAPGVRAPEAAPSRLSAVTARFPRLIPMLVLALLIGVLDVATARQIPEVSAIDELNHIDFLVRGSRGDLGQNGVVATQEALRELCDRGSDYYVFPRCPDSGLIDPAFYFVVGLNYSDNAPPYFLATGLSARALGAVTPGAESLVTWGRVLGAVWLLLGCYLVLRAGELLGLDRRLMVVALVLAAAIPAQLHASTTVNPDAAAFLAGAAVLLAVLAWEQRRSRARLGFVVLASLAALAVDSSNAVAVLLAVGYLGCRAFASPDRSVRSGQGRRPYALVALALVAGATLGFLSWEVGERLLAEPAPYYVTEYEEARGGRDPAPTTIDDPGQVSVEGIPYARIFDGDSVFGLFPPVEDIAPPPERASEVSGTLYRVFAAAVALFVAAVLVLCVIRPSLSDRVRALGLATVAALLVAPVLFHLWNAWRLDSFEATAPRFALSALPAVVLVIVGLGANRVARAVTVVLAAGLYIGALVSLI
jgi:hypothetical protein